LEAAGVQIFGNNRSFYIWGKQKLRCFRTVGIKIFGKETEFEMLGKKQELKLFGNNRSGDSLEGQKFRYLGTT
jgi:hypothetical protein